MLSHLQDYRRYIWQTAWADLRYRYAGTGLGVFWNIIHPLLEILIYTFVFSQIFTARSGIGDVPYVLFLCVGLFPWMAFAETIAQGSQAFIGNAAYLRRVAIPPEIFVARSVLAATFTYFISLGLLAGLNLAFGQPFHWSWLALPCIAVLMQAMGLGMALALASLRVFFRDIGEALRAMMQLWKWTIPIIYPPDLVPESLQWLFYLNPPYVFIAAIRQIFLEQQLPALSAWFLMVFWGGLFFLLGAWITQKLMVELRDNV